MFLTVYLHQRFANFFLDSYSTENVRGHLNTNKS